MWWALGTVGWAVVPEGSPQSPAPGLAQALAGSGTQHSAHLRPYFHLLHPIFHIRSGSRVFVSLRNKSQVNEQEENCLNRERSVQLISP